MYIWMPLKPDASIAYQHFMNLPLSLPHTHHEDQVEPREKDRQDKKNNVQYEYTVEILDGLCQDKII